MMFASLLVIMLTGYPVAFSLAGVALIFAFIGNQLEVFYPEDLAFIPSRIFGIIQNLTLIAVPLFIMMGITLDRSGLAKELLEAMQQVLRKLKGGLAISVVIVGALLAASTGIVGATVVTMGSIALPTMLKWGYQKEISCGTISAAGTLGQIIPPSIVLVLLGDMMNVDVSDLFIGAILPGLGLVLLYILYIWVRVHLQPQLAPLPADLKALDQPSLSKLLKALLPALSLMIIVLGSILGGLASPTEASACGAVGAWIITVLKGKFNWSMFKEVLEQSVHMTTMVFTILVGAQFFGVVFRGLGGDEVVQSLILDHQIPNTAILLCVMLLMFCMGFFLDFIEICFIVIPVVSPILINICGYDPLWVAILMAINLQTSFLTPPFGFALFYLKGVAPPEIKTSHLYRGILPFVGIQILALITIMLFPTLVTWLPKAIGP